MRRRQRPTTLVGILLASAVVGLVMVVVTGIILRQSEGEAADRYGFGPFRAEASMVHTAEREGTRLVSSGELEWQDSRHYRRTQLEETVPGRPPKTTILTADGDAVRFVDSSAAVYYRANNPEFERAEVTDPLFHLAWGPTGARTIEDFLDELRTGPAQPGPQSLRFAEVVRQDTILGIPVEVIEYRPLWNSVSINGGSGSAGGSGRIWVDPVTMFILRNEADAAPIYSTVVEVTVLQRDVAFAPRTFEFVPPPGKSEVVAVR